MSNLLESEAATEPQVALITNLLDLRNVPETDVKAIKKKMESGRLTDDQARTLIRKMLKLELRPDTEPLEVGGWYKWEKNFYNIVEGKHGPYAVKYWVEDGDVKSRYAKGVVFNLRARHKVTRVDAKRAGVAE